MMFSVWFLVWVIGANQVAALALPACALMTRMFFLGRVVRVGLRLLVFAIVLFGVMSYSLSLMAALVMSMQCVLILVLFAHLSFGARSSRWRVPFFKRGLGQLWHLMQRVLPLVRERALDVAYAREVALRDAEGRWQRIRVMFAWVGTLAVLYVRLAKELEVVMKARGALPHPDQWRAPAPLNRNIIYGDAALFLGTNMIWAVTSVSLLYPDDLRVMREFLFHFVQP